jgi:RNA polymerase sigma-70 factor (ECF subfamily)
MEHSAFERAALEHKDRVHGYAAMMLRDPEEARDVAQEALVRLWQNWHKVDEAGRRTWLLRTTHNLCIDRLRKRKVRAEVGAPDDVLALQADVTPGPAQRAEAGEAGRAIHAALARLSAQDRAVLVLREVQGLAYDEIAGALDVPMGTLKARLHRARERLREQLVRAGVTL